MKRIIMLAAAFGAAYVSQAETLVIAPGDGVETNVTEAINGDRGVQINSGSEDGGIVMLSNDWNMYSGDTRITCGTLEASCIRGNDKPSSLGRNSTDPQTLYVGNGTFRYSGPSASSGRRLVLDVVGHRHAAVMDITSDLAFTGGAVSESGTLLKTGSGTLTLEQPDGIYRLSTRGDGFPWPPAPTEFSANGDSPNSIYESGSLTVHEGRLAVKGSSAVTNLFAAGCADPVTASGNAGVTYIGKSSADGSERSAHLDIYGGYNHFGEYIRLDASNGFYSACNSSLNVYGGQVLTKFMYVGDARGFSTQTCPEFNVYEGGSAKIGYLHLACSEGTKSRMRVQGGRVDVAGAIYVADISGGRSENDALLPTAEVTVSSNGWLVGNLSIGSSGYSALTLRLESGGTYQLWGGINTAIGRVLVVGDGGTLRSSSEATYKNTTLRIGNGGLTLSADQALTFPGAVENDPSADKPGPLVIACRCADLQGDVGFTGEIVVNDGRALVLHSAVAASKVTMGASTLSVGGDVAIEHLAHAVGKVPTLSFDVVDGKAGMLTLRKWDVPSCVNVTLDNAVSGATYDIMTVPAESGVSASSFVATRVNGSLTAVFSVAASGDSFVVRATVGPAPAVLVDGGTRTWSNAAGGDWAEDANWTEGSAPADGERTAVSFPTASSGEKTTVSLGKGAAVSGLAFDSAPGYAISGGGTLDVYKSGTAVVSSKSGTNAVDTAMTYSGALRLAVQLGSRLEISRLEGRGDVQFNDGSNGAATGLSGLGAVVIGNASVNGALTERNGLLEVGALGPGITALSVGYGLFRYTGAADYVLNGSLTASPNNWSQAQVEIVDPEATLTVAGQVTQTEGGFTKRGKGTLVFAGEGEHLLANASMHKYSFGDAGYAGHDNVWGSNGLSPIEGSGQAQSFFGLSCAGGLLSWGRDGQTLTVRGGDLVVGTTTTASPGCEYDAAAEINGGETSVASGDIVVSRNHGNSRKNTAEKETLGAKLTVNGGRVQANNLYLAYNDWGLSKSDSRFELNGGSVEVANVCVGHRDGNVSSAAFVMNGGSLTASSWFKVAPEQGGNVGGLADMSVDINGGEVSVGSYFSFGYNSWKNPQMSVSISNATVHCAEYLRAYCGAVTLDLEDSAVVYAKGIDVFGSYAGNDHTLNFNGGRLCCTSSGFTLKDWKNLNIGEKGAYLDTTEMTGGSLNFSNPIASASGTLHVCGSDPMRSVRFGAVNPGAIGISVESGGSALAYLSYLDSAEVTVQGDGAFGSRWTSTDGAVTEVAELSLGTGSNDRAMLFFTTGSGYLTPVKVTGAFSVGGVVEVAVMNDAQTAYEAVAFTAKPVLIAKKGTIDKSKFFFSTLQPTVQATFSVTSFDDEHDQLVMTTSVDENAAAMTYVWTASTGGAWQQAVNWQNNNAPEGNIGEKVVFPESLTGRADISLGGEKTVGTLESAAENLVLAGGSLAIASSAGGMIKTTKGTLTLPAVSVDAGGLTLATSAGSTQIVAEAVSTSAPATPVIVNPDAGSGTVRLASPQNSQAFTFSSGTLEGAASAFDGGTVTMKNSTLRITEGGFVKSPVVGADEGFVLRTEEDVWFESDVSAPHTFIKAGPGTAYLGGSGSVKLGERNWDHASDNPGGLAANGDMPATKDENTFFVNAGTVVLGLNPTQEVKVPNGHVFIGSRFIEFDDAGELVQPSLDIHGGTVTLPNIRMGHGVGDYRTVAGNESKVLTPSINVYGGTVTFAGCYLGSTDGNVNSVNTLNLYGGKMTSSDQWIAFGYGRTTYAAEYGQARSVVNIHGGLLELTNPALNVGEISKTNGDTEINLYGGELSYAGRCRVTATSKATKIDIRLAGGRLTATELTCADLSQWDDETGGYRRLYWDGGVFRPRHSGALADNWTSSELAAGGAKFDLSLIGATGGVYALDMPFTRAADVTDDGGIELSDASGGGTLVLNAVNEINGPVVVRGGTLRPSVPGSVHGAGSLVLAGGTFDCNSNSFTFGSLEGAGGVATNGSIAVTGTMGPGADAPTNGLYAVVADLELGDGCVVSSPASEEDGEWKAPYFRVTGSVTGTKMVVDFGLAPDISLETGTRIKIAELDGTGSLPPVRAVNFGIERGRKFVKDFEYNEETGMIDAYVVLKPMGTIMIVR